MWLTDCSPFSLGGAAAHLKDSLADIYIISIANLHSTRHLGSADSSLKGGDIYTTIAAILSLLHVFDAAVLWYTHQDAVTLFLYINGASLISVSMCRQMDWKHKKNRRRKREL